MRRFAMFSLVLALLAGTAFAPMQVQGRDVTITDAAKVAATLDCRPIVGTFSPDPPTTLCTALSHPASDGLGMWWKEVPPKKPKTFTNCAEFAAWAETPGNIGSAPATLRPRWSAKRVGGTYQVTTTLKLDGSFTWTNPTWPGMTKYQTAAVAELIRRVKAHEMGHLQVAAEVVRVQTGTPPIQGTVEDARAWGDQWVRDTEALFNTHFPEKGSYDTITDHGIHQDKVGGLNTDIEVCQPKAAILGDVPGGTKGQSFNAALQLGKAPDEEGSIIVTPPVTWVVRDGTLPPGVTLGADGALTGTPTKAGTYTFTVKATDANEVTAQREIVVTIVETCSTPAPTGQAIGFTAGARLVSAQLAAGCGGIAVTRQSFNVAAYVQNYGPTNAQGSCEGARYGIDSQEPNGPAILIDHHATSSTQQFACDGGNYISVPPLGLPSAFSHSMSATAGTGDCARTVGASLAADVAVQQAQLLTWNLSSGMTYRPPCSYFYMEYGGWTESEVNFEITGTQGATFAISMSCDVNGIVIPFNSTFFNGTAVSVYRKIPAFPFVTTVFLDNCYEPGQKAFEQQLLPGQYLVTVVHGVKEDRENPITGSARSFTASVTVTLNEK